jgi:uncharacterized protein YjbI with pentapeptide repeats
MLWSWKVLWKIGIAITSILLLMLIVWVPVSAAYAHERTWDQAISETTTVQATPTTDATVTALNKEQLTQEVAQQQHTWDNWFWSNAATILSSFLSTLVIVIGALLGLWRWRRERQDAQDKELKERRDAQDKELKERQNELEKRAEERFQAAVTGLGDEREGARIGAAILLRTFLRPGYEQFYSQTFDLAVANLRLLRSSDPPADPDDALPLTTLSQALIVVFKEAFPLARNTTIGNRKDALQSLDATGVQLDKAYLVEADLKQVWMPVASMRNADLSGACLRNAVLSYADLRNALLMEANLSGVYLHDADLSGAILSGADLSGAELGRTHFNGADLGEVRLSGAHLSGAHLNGANLISADLSGAYLGGTNLSGADLDETNLSGADLSGANFSNALLSGVILKGTNLRRAKGLTKEQLAACKAKGAIVDEDSTTRAFQSAVTPPSPPQSNDTQSQLAPSAQESTPPPDPDGNNTASSQQEPKS